MWKHCKILNDHITIASTTKIFFGVFGLRTFSFAYFLESDWIGLDHHLRKFNWSRSLKNTVQ